MKVSDLLPSRFLKRDDFVKPTVYTIKYLAIEEVAKGEEKPILYFLESTKGLALNKTKIKQLEAGYGDDTDHWIGRKVRLTNDPTVEFGGKIVGGIKLELSKGKPVQAEPVASPPPADDMDEQEVPF
jgi:hypothetical protein